MNNEFEEKGYKLVDLNLGFEDLMVRSFEECVRVNKLQPLLSDTSGVSIHSIDIMMESLASIVHREYLTSIVEKEIDLRLIPTFCYTRKYFKGSILTSHTDRDSCEIILTYCISGPEWEINIADDTLITKIGNGVVYKGCEIPHGRSKPSSDDVIQVMNCWVISDGTRSSSAYDKQENNKNFYKKVNMKKGSLCSVMDNQLSHEICQKLINLGKGKWNQAQTYGLDNIRKSDIVWINDQWVYDLIWNYMLAANERAGWNYNIVAAESCQVTRYTKDGFYSWHRDGIGSHNELQDGDNS